MQISLGVRGGCEICAKQVFLVYQLDSKFTRIEKSQLLDFVYKRMFLNLEVYRE